MENPIKLHSSSFWTRALGSSEKSQEINENILNKDMHLIKQAKKFKAKFLSKCAMHVKA